MENAPEKGKGKGQKNGKRIRGGAGNLHSIKGRLKSPLNTREGNRSTETQMRRERPKGNGRGETCHEGATARAGGGTEDTQKEYKVK